MNGTNNSSPNKLLVLIDGRSVYTPLFSGVFWDAQDVMLDDIERIEVISGPGGTLWGVNAVNGVINIITRSAADDPGQPGHCCSGGNRGAEVALPPGRAPRRTAAGASTASTSNASTRNWQRRARQRRAPPGAGGLPRRLERAARHASAINGNAYQGKLQQPEPGTISVTGTELQPGRRSTPPAPT